MLPGMTGRRPGRSLLAAALAAAALAVALSGCGSGSTATGPTAPPAGASDRASVTPGVSTGQLAPLELIVLASGDHALRLVVDTIDLEAVAEATGHEPNGPFWDGVAEWLVQTRLPLLQGRFLYNSEAGMFQAEGTDRAALEELGAVMAPYAQDPATLTALVHDAEAAGFRFDD